MDEATARYYQALNLEPSASAEEIYQAYRDLVRVWDPQRFANSPRLEMMAEEKLNEIIAAYHALEQLRARGGGGAPEGPAGGERKAAPAAPAVADRYRAPDPPFSDAPVAPLQAASRQETATSVLEPPPAVADRYRPPEAPFSNVPAQAPAVRPEAPIASPDHPLGDLRHPAEAPFSPAPAPASRPEAAATGLNGARPVSEPRPAFRFTAGASDPEAPALTATVTVAPTAGGPTKYLDEPVTESAPAASAQQGGPSRKIQFAVAGAGALLVVAAIFFVFEILSGPVPSRAKGPDIGSAQTLPPGMVSADGRAMTDAHQGSMKAEATEQQPAPRRRRPPVPAPEEAPRQVPTGTELMAPEGRSGVGKFRIVNQSGEDAVARLVSHDNPSAALRLVYIRTGTEVNIGGIGTGVYYVTFSMGPLTSKPRVFGKQFGPFQFMQIQSTGGYESDQYQILLKPRK